jgi:hypothetical protein
MNYKKEIREMFFTSVKNDIDSWTESKRKSERMFEHDYFSPYYNNFQLNIDLYKGGLFLYNQRYEFIARYRFLFIIVDFKIWKHIRMLKKHFKKVKENKKDADCSFKRLLVRFFFVSYLAIRFLKNL